MRNVIYIGANLGKDGVMNNELFNDRPTDLIEQLKTKYPLIELLFVPCNEYANAVDEIRTAGTARAQAYAQTKRGVINNE